MSQQTTKDNMFVETLRLNQKVIGYLNRPIMQKGIESLSKSLIKENPEPYGLIAESFEDKQS